MPDRDDIARQLGEVLAKLFVKGGLDPDRGVDLNSAEVVINQHDDGEWEAVGHLPGMTPEESKELAMGIVAMHRSLTERQRAILSVIQVMAVMEHRLDDAHDLCHNLMDSMIFFGVEQHEYEECCELNNLMANAVGHGDSDWDPRKELNRE